jgi:hypothetical protein
VCGLSKNAVDDDGVENTGDGHTEESALADEKAPFDKAVGEALGARVAALVVVVAGSGLVVDIVDVGHGRYFFRVVVAARMIANRAYLNIPLLV